MKIAFLCKRRYMNKDVITDRYGRLYEIPRQLAEAGNDVQCFCWSYRTTESGTWGHPTRRGSLTWHSINLQDGGLPRPFRFTSYVRRTLADWQPDVMIGASDIPHIALTARSARRLGVPYAVDLYDNFESFGQARFPGAKPALRRAVRAADLVSCVSTTLANLVAEDYGAKGRVLTLYSTVDKGLFQPMNAIQCRSDLGLPQAACLIGTAGALDRNRGIETLYAAFALLSQSNARLHLVLAGRAEASCPIPAGPRVHFLGNLRHAQTATLFSALDAGIVCIRDTEFGRYSFPQKLLEMMACDLRVVAASVGGTRDFLTGLGEGSLYCADSAESLAAALSQSLMNERPKTHNAVPDWESEVAKLVLQLDQIVAGRR